MVPALPNLSPAELDDSSMIPVIINPGARSARAGGRLDAIQALSSRVQLHGTQGAGDAGRMAEEMARAGAPLIVAAGGDGTVNEVVNGIVKAGAADRTRLGVLPTGTMNVFAAELGMAAARLDECWRAITSGRPRRVDLWELNGVRFVQLAGVGMDAAIIQATTWESKKKYGPVSYLMSGWRLLGGRGIELTVAAQGGPEVKGTVVLVGNGRNYGGPFPMFPNAVAGDGLLDVVVMPRHGLREFYAVGRAMLSGRYAPSRGVHYFQTTGLKVTAAEPVAFEVDGELAGASDVLEFAHAGSVTVMAPVPVFG